MDAAVSFNQAQQSLLFPMEVALAVVTLFFLASVIHRHFARILWLAYYSGRFSMLLGELSSARDILLKSGVGQITVLLSELRTIYGFQTKLLVKYNKEPHFFGPIAIEIERRQKEILEISDCDLNQVRRLQVELLLKTFRHNQLLRQVDAFERELGI